GYTWWQFAASKDEVEQQTRQAATLRSAQLADAMEGQVSALLGAIDLGLQQVRAAWLRNPAEAPSIARTALGALPAGLVSHLTIVNARGYTVYSSLGKQPRTYVGDRPHFISQQSGADRLLIGKPVQARQVQDWTFIVNRPLLRDGRFAGTVNVLVRTDALAALLGRLQLSDRDLVALLHADGAFLARSLDNTAAMGKAVSADRPLLAAGAPTQGHYHLPGAVDQVGRIYAWSRLPEAGLITVVGLDEEALLAPLRAERRADRHLTALMSAVLVLAGLLLAGLYARMQRQDRQLREDNLRRRQVEAELAQSHAQLEQRVAERTAEVQRELQRIEALLNTTQDGFFAADASARIRHVNPAYCAMLGYGEAELLAMGIPDVEANENPEETAVHIRKVLVSGHDRFETRHGRKDGSVVDVEVSVSLVTI
ncbi:MAG: PAS domain S-box protein, partial [Hylemonella sp.]